MSRAVPGQMQTIEQFVDDFYRGMMGLMGKNVPMPQGIRKDAPVLTSTSGYLNPIYGRAVWNQLNLDEANAFALLRKVPMISYSHMLITAQPTRGGAGQAENASLPATVKFTPVQIATDVKTLARNFNISEKMIEKSKMGDGISDLAGWYRREWARHFVSEINYELCDNAEVTARAGSGATARFSDTADKSKVNDLEPLDRQIANNAEQTILDANQHGAAQAGADWYDCWASGTYDRDADTEAYRSYVDENDGTDRAFEISMLDTMIYTLLKRGCKANRSVIMTGFDTMKEIQQCLSNSLSYNPAIYISTGMNGLGIINQPEKGINAGVAALSYMGVPIVATQDCPSDYSSDATTSIDRVFMWDQDFVALEVRKPPMYYEANSEGSDPFLTGYLGQEGMYHAMMELKVYGPHLCGKIRDLIPA